jgi:hypothetical protein
MHPILAKLIPNVSWGSSSGTSLVGMFTSYASFGKLYNHKFFFS